MVYSGTTASSWVVQPGPKAQRLPEHLFCSLSSKQLCLELCILGLKGPLGVDGPSPIIQMGNEASGSRGLARDPAVSQQQTESLVSGLVYFHFHFSQMNP